MCPLKHRCLEKEIIYQATVEQQNKESKTYVKLTAKDFKARCGVCKKSFDDPDYNPTSLSNHIHELASKGIEPKVTRSYSLVTDVSHLCNKEDYYVIFELNRRSELFFYLYAQ